MWAVNVPAHARPSGLMEKHRAFLHHFVQKSGPSPSEFATLDSWFKQLRDEVNSGQIGMDDLQGLWKDAGPAITSLQTMQGFALRKPHGYAGDFEMIDRIYQEWLSPDANIANWDKFFHSQSAVKAVRNRKAYFLDWLEKHEANFPAKTLRLLNIGSGPSRDLFEYFTKKPISQIVCDCVDADPKAIAYASKLCSIHGEKIQFHAKNAFRFQTKYTYQLIWSGGLFDYLDDRLFVVLLRLLWRKLAPEGEMVIGNFSPKNPTRAYMELLGGWFLHHRDTGELAALAAQAGIPAINIRVGQEPEGINLFLHMRKSPTCV
jgi:SAM-dependent methyltransferase